MRECRDKSRRPDIRINRSVPTVSNAPITLGSGAATGELMKMSNAAWKRATAPIDPPLELNNHVNRIEPRTTDMNHPPAPARPRFDRPELKANNGTCHPAHPNESNSDARSAEVWDCRRGSAKPRHPTSSPNP